jgi:multiple sugar transport system substrate-binding protein
VCYKKRGKLKRRKAKRDMSKGRFALFGYIGIVLALFSGGCSGGEKPSGGARHLTLAVNSGVEGEALKQAAKDYETQTGVSVSIVEFPYNNLFEKELVDLNARTGAYDLIMLDDPWFPKFASQGFLTELAPFFAQKGLPGPDADFMPASLAVCRQPYEKGNLYALPYVGNSQLFFYRKDLFEKHKLAPPKTWDDVKQAAATIHEAEKTSANGGQLNGYVMRAAQGNAVVADFLPIFWAYGAEMFDADGKPTVNTPPAVAALKMMLELGRYAPPGYASFNADEVNAHLLQGTAAQSINWPAWIASLNDPAKSKVIGLMEITAMPGARQAGRAEIGNWLIAIPRDARNKPEAFDFLLWATAADQMKRSALRGNPPTRRSVFNDKELQAKFPAYPAQLASLETSKPRPRTAQWNEIENAFGIYLSKANSGELSAEDALNQAQAELEKIVARGK